MKSNQIIKVVEQYEEQLHALFPEPRRVQTNGTCEQASSDAMLQHALYLCGGVKHFVGEGKLEKANRHLGFLQAILSYAGWYTIDDLREHNRIPPSNPNFVPIPFRR